VGGRFGDGALTNEIWLAEKGSAPSLLEVPGYEPRHVMAATVSLADRMLWVLDEQQTPNGIGFTRLVRINYRSLEHEVVWEGRRFGYYDTNWLSVDRDGQVLLTSSSRAFDTHVTVKFDAIPYSMGKASPMLMHHGAGTLVGPPLVDVEDYVFHISDGQGQIRPTRVERFHNISGTAINLAGCL
jgi:hypothetical protein